MVMEKLKLVCGQKCVGSSFFMSLVVLFLLFFFFANLPSEKIFNRCIFLGFPYQKLEIISQPCLKFKFTSYLNSLALFLLTISSLFLMLRYVCLVLSVLPTFISINWIQSLVSDAFLSHCFLNYLLHMITQQHCVAFFLQFKM